MESTSFQLKPDVQLKQFDDEGIIVDLAKGYYFALNAEAYLLLNSMLKSKSKEDAVKEVTKAYDVTDSDVETDLNQLLDQMLNNELIQF